MMPPPQVSCSRDHLTSHTGGVTGYSRSRDEMTITVLTDEGTRQQVKVMAPFKMLLAREPFKEADWTRVENGIGKLKPGMRVTLWVCDDGTQPLIDWNPAAN